MTVLSGKFGAINGFSTVRNWVMNETTIPAEFRASNTYAGTGRREGVYDYQGSCEGYAGLPPVMPGGYFDFAGYTAPTTGVHGANGITHSAANAIVEEVTINWNWENCELLNWSMRFAAGEPLILGRAASSVTDLVVPDPPVICGTKVTLTSQNTVWPNIVSASLTITAANAKFVNSTTQCKTGRHPGNINWTASVIEQATGPNATLSGAPCLTSEVGGDNILKLWVDDTDYWDLHWAHLVDITDLRVDMDSGEIIRQTNNFAMNGFVGGADGWVGRPGEDGASNPYWWPTLYIAEPLPF